MTDKHAAAAVKALRIASTHHFHQALAAKRAKNDEDMRYNLEQAVLFGDAASAAGCDAHPGQSARDALAGREVEEMAGTAADECVPAAPPPPEPV